MRTIGIILAAGRSSRMGRVKALLSTRASHGNETSFLRRSITTLGEAGLKEIHVVANSETEAAIRNEAGDLADVSINPVPENGMVSSILVGLDAAAGLSTDPAKRVDRILMTLVDTPEIPAERIREMLAYSSPAESLLLIPRYDDGQGHPVLIYASAFDLLRQPLERGLKTLIAENSKRIAEIRFPGPQPRDVDTPESYQTYLSV